MLCPIGIFILTITRIQNNKDLSKTCSSIPIKGTPKANRKKYTLSSSAIYKFNCFDDFFTYAYSIREILKGYSGKIAKNTAFYLYKNKYYLIFKDINTDYPKLKSVFSIITEFASFASYSDLFMAKLYESGIPIFPKDALLSCIFFYK